MHRIALLGHEISYSRSPNVHRAIGKAIGEDIVCDIVSVPKESLNEEVDNLLNTTEGFFVTKPYKTEISRILSSAVSSVNVVRSRDKCAINTDGIGFMRALDRNFKDWRNAVNSVLVLGAGGAARSVVQALKTAGKKVYVLNRTLIRAVRLCSETGAELYTNQPAEMIVNCTDVGRSGDDVLQALCIIPSFGYAFDLIYGDEPTPFLRRIARSGGAVAGGDDMLIYQAIEGDKFLFGLDIDAEEIFDKTRALLEE